jgi:hypothetical protein
LRLSQQSGRLAEDFIQTLGSPEATWTAAATLDVRLNHVICPAGGELIALKACFGELVANPPERVNAVLNETATEDRFWFWFASAAAAGAQAGLDRDSLFAGRFLAFSDRLSFCDRFVQDRLWVLWPFCPAKVVPTLISLFAYSYPDHPCQRCTVVAHAHKVLQALEATGEVLDRESWIVRGFHEGLLVASQEPELKQEMFDELAPSDLDDVRHLAIEFIGHYPARWKPPWLVDGTWRWCRRAHPRIIEPTSRVVEFTLIRHLFDFAFWMGLVLFPPTFPR